MPIRNRIKDSGNHGPKSVGLMSQGSSPKKLPAVMTAYNDFDASKTAATLASHPNVALDVEETE